MAPSIPPSLSVRWSRDGVGIFSVLLSGGKPLVEVLWAADGTTLSTLLSRERARDDSEGKAELKSVCVLLRSTSESRRAGHLRRIRSPSVDCNAECEKMNEHVDGMKQLDERMEEEEDMDPSYINTVRLRKEKKERLRVTVEITHPALRLPAYLTWTEPAEEASS